MDTRRRHVSKNPKETANFLSFLFFGWLIPIFRKASKRKLNAEDIYSPMKSDESQSLGNRLQREWNKELIKANKELKLGNDGSKNRSKKPNLTWAILRMFWSAYITQGIIFVIGVIVMQSVLAIFQGFIISYFNPEEKVMTRNHVLFYAGLVSLCSATIMMTWHHSFLKFQQIGMCIRIACCSLVYRKILRLNLTTMNNTAAGQIANLISNDVARFDTALAFLNHIWILPIQMILTGYAMWNIIGMTTLVAIGSLLLLSLPVQTYASSLSAHLRSQIAVSTDERMQLMSELVSGIQIVKMYSWEKPFEVMVSNVRKLEIKLITYTSYLRGFLTNMMVLLEKSALFLTIICFVLAGNSLNARTVYVVGTLLYCLQLTCGFCFAQAVSIAGETVVSLKRLTEFLLLDEVKCVDKDSTVSETRSDQKFEYGIRIEMVKVAANWVYGQLPSTLCEVSLEVKSRSLCAVVGPVGSGKSSLLHLVLGELSVGGGKLTLFTGEKDQTKINGQDVRISYTSQDPWLFSASVRENILFGQPYDEKRYQEVIRVCALLKDLEHLPNGDATFVGERGASLSGGQKARVNLARAVYKDADIYLFDDPFSAVDARVGCHLFEECITNFLNGKTRILVTHRLEFLQHADTVIVLNRGTVESQGTYEELAKSNPEVLHFQKSDQVGEEDCGVADNIAIKVEIPGSVNENNLPSKVSDDNEQFNDVEEEGVAAGKISNELYWKYFSAGGNIFTLVLLTVSFIAGQVMFSGCDYWVMYWTNLEMLRTLYQKNQSLHNINSYRYDNNSNNHSIGSEWLDEYGLLRSNAAMCVYTFFVVSTVFLFMFRSMLFMKVSMTASRNIHNAMFSNLLRAPMRFFNINPVGRILNRFSKDVGAMDEILPKEFLLALQAVSVLTGAAIMLLIVNPWMFIPAIILSTIFYFNQKYYVKTAKELKRLEVIAKSPVFSHVSSTVDGLTTIRSRGVAVEQMLLKEFDCHQDTHTGAYYLNLNAGITFALTSDVLAVIFAACVSFSAILRDNGNTFGGSVGMTIFQSIVLSGLVQFGMRQVTMVISEMTSVERLLQYTNLPTEGPVSQTPPPPTWPAKGCLSFNNVSMRYGDNEPPALEGINLNINSGWKVGIVGRTGAGKSSLISALFRLTGDGLDGEIILDGIDTKSIGLQELRSCISIIPQEPTLFSASLRYNLDPFKQYSDAELWDSLREVELGDAVTSLDSHVAGGGANFSVGQRQLICLARAIVRNNRLLVLDEATANIDPSTDSLIQATIRRKFADCTVLTIAHRLNTIMDSDRVLVMADGCAVEFDHPYLLLQNKAGYFHKMLEQCGNPMAADLYEIAKSAYLDNPEFEKSLNNDTKSLVYNKIFNNTN